MASRDIQTRITPGTALNIQIIVAQTEVVGNILDLSTFRSVSFALMVGAHTSGILSLVLEDGDNPGLSDAVNVEQDFLIGTIEATQIQIANQVTSIGYVGHKRFIRAKILGVGGAVTATAAVLIYADTRTVSPVPTF